MKTRPGFVSNSSTTSFCVFGIAVSIDRIDALEEMIDDISLETFYGDPDSYDRQVYIGKEYSSIADDETMSQFKERISTAIKTLLPDEDHDCSLHEESYRDG